jgi:hypothetical protein
MVGHLPYIRRFCCLDSGGHYNQLLENQTKLIDRLLTYVDDDKQTVQRVIDASTPTMSKN